MSHLSFFILLFIPFTIHSQKKWDGGGGNNQWNNALNWTANTLPSITDDVVLDNSILTSNYNVVLPSAAVTVKTITITPSASRAIELTLPATNTFIPGLTVSGPGYGLTINSGGTFRNSSGSASGNTVRIIDSIRINNDGRYIHNSASGHSTNVQVLATLAGSEKGILELDIPAASSTISISGRTFGKFVLRSTAAGGTCNYTAAGTSKVNIRGSLDIGAGVNFNLNCSDTIFVGGDLLQDAGTFNLGNSTRSVVLAIFQNITQNTGGVITESGTGIQTILVNGTGLQLMVFKGIISNQVALVKVATGTVLSKWPLALPYKLGLKNGRIVTTQGLITLQSGCSIEADTLSNSFIDGPLRKDGLNSQSFIFPVGKSGVLRWVQLKNATGNFTVEYFRTDPKSLSSINGSGIDHISAIEYWDISTTSGATAELKLSFTHPGSGLVTNLSSLRVARLINGTWQDAGNAAVSGTPGSDGWVSSNAAGGFSADSKSFALASAMGLENPLPLSSMKLRAVRNNNIVILSWSSDREWKLYKTELQRSYDGIHYVTIYETYERSDFSYMLDHRNVFFRLKSDNGVKDLLSNIVFIQCKEDRISTYAIADLNGRIIKMFRQYPSLLITSLKNNFAALPAGLYIIHEASGSNVIKYLKR